MTHRIIPIQPARPAPRVVSPQLQGDATRLQGVIDALQRALGAQLGLVEPAGAWLRALRLETDEAELSLAPGLPYCGSELSQTAFETLRLLLPDTDIYVRTAAR